MMLKKRPMRSEEEISAVFDEMGEQSDDPTEQMPKPLAGLPFHAWHGDTFKYGYLMGKFMALGWVLGDPITADIKIDHDFESWVEEHPPLGGQKESEEEL